jgi:hypothetical protein
MRRPMTGVNCGSARMPATNSAESMRSIISFTYRGAGDRPRSSIA